jgi:hypothetical protein
MLSPGSALATGRSIIVDAYRHRLAFGRGLPAESEQRQKRSADEHDYDVRVHCPSMIARYAPKR